MSHIGKNIRKIRTVKKLSQADFAALFNLARPSVGAYEEGRSEPKIDTIIQIAAHFGIGIDMLLTKDITINELYHIDRFEKEIVQKKQKPENDNAITLVDESHLAQYISQKSNKEFIKQLPIVHLPLTTPYDHRAFVVTSAEMQVNSGGIHPGDLILGKKVDSAELISSAVFIIFTPNHYYIRRFSSKAEKLLIFEADNRDYAPVRLSEEELLEIWQVIGYYSTQLPQPHTIEARLAALEQQVRDLQQLVGKN